MNGKIYKFPSPPLFAPNFYENSNLKKSINNVIQHKGSKMMKSTKNRINNPPHFTDKNLILIQISKSIKSVLVKKGENYDSQF